MNVEFNVKPEAKYWKFAVILSHYHGQWVLCRHKDRDTWECPGGHWEEGETIDETARRELYEETGAVLYEIHRLGEYSVSMSEESPAGDKTYGMLYFADVQELGELPESEIECVELFTDLPEDLTYPQIQPFLMKTGLEHLKCRQKSVDNVDNS